MKLKLAGTALYLAVWPALVIGLSGDWRWPAGWIFSVWLVALCTSAIAWLYRKDPALLAERYRRPGTGGQSRGDQSIVYLLMVGFVAWIVLMPLDALRFGWTPPLPLAVPIAGGAMLAGSAFLFLRAFIDNTYLSPLVRVQTERQHQVVSTGVYGFVRHPMYLGAALMFVGGPLLVGALTSLAVGALLTALLAFRIVGEEKLLVRELPGYDDYRRRVRWRLVPFVW
jgi:protein-S-isoprenylcysteine O-methyltransferase Ste14